jgi:23S rRNA (uracil1939-C5)-methyltransferase
MKLAGTTPELGVIHDLSADGVGIATVAGKRVFIDGALPGETVSFTRRRRKRSYDEAQLQSVDIASPHRMEPRCQYFGRCGGCALQHLDPAQQLVHKDAILRHNLKRIGQLEARQYLAPVGGAVWGYRRRARLAVRDVPAKGRVLVGFRERLQPYVTDMLGCETLRPEAARLIEPLSALIGGLSIRVRLPQVEISVADNATALVFRVLEEPSLSDLQGLRNFRRIHNLRILLQRTAHPKPEPLVPGEDDASLFYSLNQYNLKIGFSATDFVQINETMNHELIAAALRHLQLSVTDRVLDLFCGLGNFSLPMARSAAEVVGVEIDRGMVERAAQNARINDIDNVQFHAADLATPRETPVWPGSFDAVLLDPPRTGALEVLPAIAATGARRIAYISCHPGTLARDAGELARTHGYVLKIAGVFDMFPHTSHVESLALFERQ